jgi:hypothetical protein
MKIAIRLIGFSEIVDNDKVVYDLILSTNIFNFDYFENYIISKYKKTDITQSEEFIEAQCNNFKNELLQCSLTCNSKNLKKETLNDDTETLYKVFLFTANNDIKGKLINIFKVNGIRSSLLIINKSENNNESEDNNESENDKESDNNESENDKKSDNNESENDNETQYENNEEINIEIENYNDKDFILLLKIYKSKPHLFNLLYKLLSTNKTITNIKTVSKFDAKLQYNISEIIKEIVPNISDEDINNILNHTGLNINLVIRYLIHI